ncbi:mitochondrial inner membrane translocase complex, subunit Tim17/22 [Pseudohyphozyma bogoriensis]|nr:mitochondrial inner membrane translocase complex, subunit Tim17/22 [Pseudohyphozyma bogoriensis]
MITTDLPHRLRVRPASRQVPRENLDVVLPPRPFLPPTTPLAPSTKPHYEPTGFVQPAFNAAVAGAGVGLFASTIKNSLESHSKGALGVITRTGWMAGYFAAAGAAFAGVQGFVADSRGTRDDGVASAFGGCAAGFVLGIRSGKLPTAFGLCAVLGAVEGTFDLAGGGLGAEGPVKERKEREEDRVNFFKKKSVMAADE